MQGNAFLKLAAGRDIGDHLPRYLRAVLNLRPDVASAYDDGHNRNGLIGWLFDSGPGQLHIDPALPTQLGISPHEPLAAHARESSGVNCVGYFRSHLGVAEAARNAVSALEAVDLEVATYDISQLAESPKGHYALARDAGVGARHAVTIIGANADETPRVLDSLPAELRATVLVGYWAWETPEFPEEWCDRFDLVDEVWVASHFIADAIRAKATVPVTVVPYAVSPPATKPDRAWLARMRPEIQDGEFIFLSLFDVASVPFRKNPEGTIAAFRQAFRPDEPVRTHHQVAQRRSRSRVAGAARRGGQRSSGDDLG